MSAFFNCIYKSYNIYYHEPTSCNVFIYILVNHGSLLFVKIPKLFVLEMYMIFIDHYIFSYYLYCGRI